MSYLCATLGGRQNPELCCGTWFQDHHNIECQLRCLLARNKDGLQPNSQGMIRNYILRRNILDL